MSRFNEHGLTPQQEIFAGKVASGSSNVEAYLSAYKVRNGRTDKSLAEMACKVASHIKVTSRIAALQATAADVAILRAADIMLETRRVALSSALGFFTEDGRQKMPHELDPDTAACVASWEISDEGLVKYRLWDKNAACERASKILGLYKEDNKQKTDPLQSLLDTLSWNVIGVKPDNRAKERGLAKSGGEKTDDSPSDEALTPDGALSVPDSKVFGPRSGDDS